MQIDGSGLTCCFLQTFLFKVNLIQILSSQLQTQMKENHNGKYLKQAINSFKLIIKYSYL